MKKEQIDKAIARLKRLWGLDEWEITWAYGDLQHEADIEPKNWGEKRAHITIDRETARNATAKQLKRILAHELGHPVVAPIWRSMTDFADHHLKKKERAAYEDVVNSAENLVIDHILRVLGV